MRPLRWLGKISLTLAITVIFVTVSLIPKPTRSAFAADPAAPPLPMPEDPLGQQPEQEIPEISINVDARDGHLVVRVVDIWGPGRTPLVARSWTNASASSAGLGYWHLNHDLDGAGREPDGNVTIYKYSTTRYNATQTEKWDVYVDDIGTYSTLEIHYVNCEAHEPQQQGAQGITSSTATPRVAPTPRPGPTPRPAPTPRRAATFPPTSAGQPLILDHQPLLALAGLQPGEPVQEGAEDLIASHVCTPDGTSVVYLPKGATRTYVGGPIQEARDANGNVTTFTWTSFADQIRPYIWKVRDPVGREITYGHEPWFSECLAEHPETGACINLKWHYRVRSVTDPYGRTATYTFDGAGYLVSATNAAGRTTSYTYSAAGLLSSVTNSRGYVTSIQWTQDTGGGPWRVTRVTAPDGAATNYGYTVSPTTQRVTRTVVTNARGSATTHDFYSGTDENYFGNLMQVTDPLGNVTQFTYDARHNVTQVTDPRGNRTTYTYSSRNKVTQAVGAAGSLNLTSTLTWDTNDNLLSVTNPRGIRTDYTYNATHNLTSVRRAVGTADESLTQYTYTTWGGVASVIDPRNFTTTYTYTARRQIQTITPPVGGTTSFTYNTLDDQVTRTDGNGRIWTAACDVSRLITSVTDPLGNVIRHTYDANGNRLTTTDPKNLITAFAYDNRDRPTTITDPLNGQTRYAYDAVSNLTQLTNARNFATTFTYDAANRLTQVRDILNQTTAFAYDAASNRTQQTDRKGQVQTFAYDAANRPTSTTAGGQTISYTYNANGSRLTMVDPTGTTSSLYDSLDRQTRVTYPDGKTVQAAYDKNSNRTSLTNPGAVVTTATYDAANRLTQMTQGALAWTFGYDAAGNRTSLGHPNGTSITYAYLNNHWLSSVTHKKGATTLQSFTYTYDANGNRLTQADSSGTTSFTYDALNRLTQAAYPGTYGTYGWTYDAVGNRTQQTAPAGTTAYTYDANNRLTQAGSATYAYDQNGNLTSISTGRTFAWDVFNRLTATTASGSTVTHTYNGDGLKTKRVGPNGTTNYYYAGIRPIWETNSAGAMTAQYDRDLFGNLLSRLESGTRRYYHHDGLGSTTAITDTAGAVSATMLYDAWGNVRTNSGSTQGNYRFTGAERDVTTGLYHMGARFYDPTIGRWLSEDPVQDRAFEPTTLNFYSYVSNSPLIYVDPAGTEKTMSAEDRLQAFIDAMIDLYAFIELLTQRGQTQLASGLHLGIQLLGIERVLAIMASARQAASETRPSRQAILALYRSAVAERIAAAGLFGVALLAFRSGDFVRAYVYAEWGVAALAAHLASANLATSLDRQHYRGEIFRSLTFLEHVLLWPFRP